MQINSIPVSLVRPSSAGEPSANAVQVKLMKKVLDSQKEQMARLLHQMEGKGRHLDVSV